MMNLVVVGAAPHTLPGDQPLGTPRRLSVSKAAALHPQGTPVVCVSYEQRYTISSCFTPFLHSSLVIVGAAPHTPPKGPAPGHPAGSVAPASAARHSTIS